MQKTVYTQPLHCHPVLDYAEVSAPKFGKLEQGKQCLAAFFKSRDSVKECKRDNFFWPKKEQSFVM